jgi:23S rRNA pseudouridine1911/1915/1917 synthase
VSGYGGPGSPVTLVVPRESAGSRLDRFVAGGLEVSRAEVQRWIDAERVTVGGSVGRASQRVSSGDAVVVRPDAPPATAAEPEEGIRFAILHVDESIVVLDKPAGLVVHPARGHAHGTLVHGLLARGLFRRELLEADGRGERDENTRPGIVHRLDKGTSGVMVVARTAAAREGLKAQFQAHSIERAYEALVAGDAQARVHATLHGRHPHDRLRFTTRVAHGKAAVTRVEVLGRLEGATHVRCTLETGRTHQIRVHLAETGTPVLGDPLYGKALLRDAQACVRVVGERLGHQALHARVLGIVHPTTGVRLRFETPPPPDFEAALAALTAGAPSGG